MKILFRQEENFNDQIEEGLEKKELFAFSRVIDQAFRIWFGTNLEFQQGIGRLEEASVGMSPTDAPVISGFGLMRVIRTMCCSWC